MWGQVGRLSAKSSLAGSTGCGHITIATTALSFSLSLSVHPLSFSFPLLPARLFRPLSTSSFSSHFIAARFARSLAMQLIVSLSRTIKPTSITVPDNNSEFSLSLLLSLSLSFSLEVSFSALEIAAAVGIRDGACTSRELPSRRIVDLLQWPALLNVSLSSAFPLPMRRCAQAHCLPSNGRPSNRSH